MCVGSVDVSCVSVCVRKVCVCLQQLQERNAAVEGLQSAVTYRAVM